MPLKHCLDCKKLGEWKGARCPPCKNAKVREYESDAAKKAKHAARYGWPHQQRRQEWAKAMQVQTMTCCRCQKPIRIDPLFPDKSDLWDLDHTLNLNQSLPAHRSCNRGAWVADEKARKEQQEQTARIEAARRDALVVTFDPPIKETA